MPHRRERKNKILLNTPPLPCHVGSANPTGKPFRPRRVNHTAARRGVGTDSTANARLLSPHQAVSQCTWKKALPVISSSFAKAREPELPKLQMANCEVREAARGTSRNGTDLRRGAI